MEFVAWDLEQQTYLTDLSSALDISVSGMISGTPVWNHLECGCSDVREKKKDFRLIAISFGLMFYPYFHSRGPWQDWGAGILSRRRLLPLGRPQPSVVAPPVRQPVAPEGASSCISVSPPLTAIARVALESRESPSR
jgi:hypothetical protein